MGYHVGLPVMKCSLNPSVQIHAKSGKRSKTCSISKAWAEMNDQRLGIDPDIDRTRTHQNVWMDGDSSDKLEEQVRQKIEEINQQRREEGCRALRKDAVSVIQIIEKPPIDYMRTLSYEEKKQFLYDSHSATTELIKQWNPKWQILESVQHHDEMSAHNHTMILLTTLDANSHPTFNAKQEVNRSFFRHINEHYPEKMREFGYAIDNCRMYDSLTEEEKMERRLHPEGGMDSAEYKQKVEEEAKQKLQFAEIKEKDLQQLEIALKEEKEIFNTEKQEFAAMKGAADFKSYQETVNENHSLKEELSLKDQIIERLQSERDRLFDTAEKMRRQLSDISRQAGAKLMSLFGYKGDQSELNLYPSKTITSGIRQMFGDIERKDSRSYRVLPDPENENKFRVAYREKSGRYETVQGGFGSRDSADQFRRNIADSTREMSRSTEDSIEKKFGR